MKGRMAIGVLALFAGSILAADGGKEEVKNAAKGLGDKTNYSWATTTEGTRPGTSQGKTEKGGVTCVNLKIRDNDIEIYLKGDKGAIKAQDGWKSLSEAAEGGGNGERLTRMVKSMKTPAAEVAELVDKVKELKKDDDALAGDLTDEGAKAVLAAAARRAGANAEPTEAKGSLKVWIKDGVISKYQFKLEGKLNINGNETPVERTTTVEIKDVGSTKIELPDDAKQKLSA